MNDACVSLEEVLSAAAARSAALVPETAGYLTLALTDASSRMPLLLDERDIIITVDGDVTLLSRGEVVHAAEGARLLRSTLTKLLSVATGSHSGLSAAARRPPQGDHRTDDVADDIEAALIPINRSAARRALARLARETLRARASGARKPAPMPAPQPITSRPPPSPGERRLETLRATRNRAGSIAARAPADSAPPFTSPRNAAVARRNLSPLAPLVDRLASVSLSAAPSRLPARGLTTIPQATLFGEGGILALRNGSMRFIVGDPVPRGLGEIRIRPGGLGEIRAPSNPIEVIGVISEPMLSREHPVYTDSLLDALARPRPLPPPPPLSLPALTPDRSDPLGASPYEAREQTPCSTSSPDISFAELDFAESDSAAMIVEHPDTASFEVTSDVPTAALVEPVEIAASFDDLFALIDIDLLDPFDSIDVTGSPTIVMPLREELSEVFLTGPLHTRITLPWPSSWTYEPAPWSHDAERSQEAETKTETETETSDATTLILIEDREDEVHCAPVEPNEPDELREPSVSEAIEPDSLDVATTVGDSAETEPSPSWIDDAPALTASESPPEVHDDGTLHEREEAAERPSDPGASTGAAADLSPSLAVSVTHADELLLRFGTAHASEASVRAAAKGLRAIAGIDLTPTIAPLAVAHAESSQPLRAASAPYSSAFNAPSDVSDDATPPATSPPAPVSSPVPRIPRARSFVSAGAFAAGLAAASILMHVQPDFPDSVVARLAQAIPTADLPLAPASSPAEMEQIEIGSPAASPAPREGMGAEPAAFPPSGAPLLNDQGASGAASQPKLPSGDPPPAQPTAP